MDGGAGSPAGLLRISLSPVDSERQLAGARGAFTDRAVTHGRPGSLCAAGRARCLACLMLSFLFNFRRIFDLVFILYQPHF